jgi:nucleoside-diphosphate-sugar epimerase
LLEHGDVVRGLVRSTSDLSLLTGLAVERVTGSLEDAASLVAATRGVGTVYHVAGAVSDWGPLAFFRRINVEGTRHVLDAAVANGVKRFVYVSSTAVHSFTGARDMNETSPQFPTPFPYCQSKREAEALTLKYHRREAIQATIVRPGDIYGPGDRTSLLKLAGLLEAGRMAYIGRGETLGAFTYVENLADGLILAGTTSGTAGQAYVITDGLQLSWRSYFEGLSEALNLPRPRIYVPPWLAWAAASVLEGAYHLFRIRSRPPITRYLVAHLSHDYSFRIDKVRRDLGYVPRVDFDEAIARTAAWYKGVIRAE